MAELAGVHPHRSQVTDRRLPLRVRAPATGELLGTLPNLDEEEVRALVARARAAQPAWVARPIRERQALLDRFRRLLAEGASEAAELSAAESGKTIFEALIGDVLPTLDLARFYARRAARVMAPRRQGSWILSKAGRIEREPYGVVAVISPWNFPITNPMRVVLAALVTGNTVVLKASEQSPMSVILMRRLALEVGFPEDVFLVATGDGVTGAALVEAGVDQVSFTGSVGIGRQVAEAAARRLLPHTLELGGKNPMVVLADADLERAVNGAVQGAFWNAGQICISVERVYVEAPIYDAFVEQVVEATEALTIADEANPDGDVGAVTTQVQVDRLLSQLDDARSRGARILTGGEPVGGPGRHFAPTVVADADHSMAVMREESFAPVLPIMKVADAEEAIRLANDSSLGLAASIWTRRSRGRRLVRRLEAGMVSVNDILYHGAMAGLPFGGVGESGYGRVHGEEGLREVTQARAIVVDRLGLKREPVGGYPFSWFGRARARALIRLLHGSGLLSRLAAAWRLLRGG